MPARMDPKKNLVARPDRVDFRDRPYQPPLRSLPEQYPPQHLIKSHFKAYVDDGLILDQGTEGACTGFGLAAVINYIYWSRWQRELRQFREEGGANKPSAKTPPPKPACVSAHMLFRNARIHDEWEGEGYDWSSCRGAMKGWHKHGVCEWDLWPSSTKRPAEEWAYDAALRPLGAYYRVNAKSIADMQAAIHEVNAVYCASDVHTGWMRPSLRTRVSGEELAVIQPGGRITGGHAFAMVGYTRDGFIIQNSWGKDWGSNGFALVTYEDWIKNGYDAWVAALGAPMNIGVASGAAAGAGRSGSMMASAFASLPVAVGRSVENTVPPWAESRAYEHAVVLGNDGVLIDRLPEAQNPGEALAIVAEEKVAELDCDNVVIYVHGGLNDEEAAIARACRLGPWFLENRIHPIFVIWRTGILEALGQIALDDVSKFEEQIRSIRTRGMGDIVEEAIRRARNAFDLGFEAAAEKFLGKPVWTQMKQNAALAARPGMGLDLLARKLARSGKPVHVLGHSAGAIMIGHLLGAARRAGLAFASCGLYAPACTLAFAVEHYGRALTKGGPLSRASLHIDNLTDEAEIRDTVGPYGKSLLYLVSRALEEKRKMPLLGLDIALKPGGKGRELEFDSGDHAKLLRKWLDIAESSGRVTVKRHAGPDVMVSEKKRIPIAHGSFDNDCAIINASLRRILGRQPKVRVSDLSGF